MSADDVLNAKDSNTSQGINEENSFDEKSKERINAIISELNDLINDIRNSRQISQGIAQSQVITHSETATQSQGSNANDAATNALITQAAQTLAALNSIKTELCRLPLDFCEREYIANCVTPLENTMESISRTSFQLSTSVSILTTSPIVPRKKRKLKDSINTIYDMNEDVEDIYKVLEKRLKKLTGEDNFCSFP